jgi:hypothetical protein
MMIYDMMIYTLDNVALGEESVATIFTVFRDALNKPNRPCETLPTQKRTITYRQVKYSLSTVVFQQPFFLLKKVLTPPVKRS